MGTYNHGTQEITYEYFEDATAKDFNKRHLDIQPRGIYKGGYLTRVSDSEVTLSILTAEIGDDDEQISVKTSTLATLEGGGPGTDKLDSGSISSGTPFIVLRWGFLEQQNNYVEIHAIASVSNAQANDIIIGKCVFDGGILQEDFDYTDRTFLTVQDLFFKVETSSDLYVQLRAGRIQNGTQYIIVPEQKVGLFSVPGSPNSRIDLVYIDTDGTVMIQQGVQAVSPTAPDYESRLVVAEVRIVNGDTSIPADRITDVRSFLTSIGGLGQNSTKNGTTDIYTTSGSWSNMSDMDITLITSGGNVLLLFSASIEAGGNQNEVGEVRFTVDGSGKAINRVEAADGANEEAVTLHHLEVGLSAGSHIFRVQWKSVSNRIDQKGASRIRILSAIELPH